MLARGGIGGEQGAVAAGRAALRGLGFDPVGDPEAALEVDQPLAWAVERSRPGRAGVALARGETGAVRWRVRFPGGGEAVVAVGGQLLSVRRPVPAAPGPDLFPLARAVEPPTAPAPDRRRSRPLHAVPQPELARGGEPVAARPVPRRERRAAGGVAARGRGRAGGLDADGAAPLRATAGDRLGRRRRPHRRAPDAPPARGPRHRDRAARRAARRRRGGRVPPAGGVLARSGGGRRRRRPRRGRQACRGLETAVHAASAGSR